MTQTPFIEYREAGILKNAYSVTLEDKTGTWGLKEYDSGEILLAPGTPVINPDTGIYQIPLNGLKYNTVYVLSWKVIPNLGDEPRWKDQYIGPLAETSPIRGVQEFRGKFRQSELTVMFLRIAELSGNGKTAEAITFTVNKESGSFVLSAIPEYLGNGCYFYEWQIPEDQEVGTYKITWNYMVDDEALVTTQSIVVSDRLDASTYSPYHPRMIGFRERLALMMPRIQNIPVYDEEPRRISNNHNVFFSFDKWNVSPYCRIYRNSKQMMDKLTIDYHKGKVIFDEPLLKADTVNADYSFKWFTDEQLDGFLSNALHRVNATPQRTTYSFMDVDDKYVGTVMDGAITYALRAVMLDLQFQEPQMVFGGAEGAKNAFTNFQSLAKDHQDAFDKALENKKYQSYVGRTKSLVTPPYALPGSAARFYRMMFSGGGNM